MPFCTASWSHMTSDDLRLDIFLKTAAVVSRDHPVVISKYITGAKEVEMDAIGNEGELVNYAIAEHIENAGVHSGDATLPTDESRAFRRSCAKRWRSQEGRGENAVPDANVETSVKFTGPCTFLFLSDSLDLWGGLVCASSNELALISCLSHPSVMCHALAGPFNIQFICKDNEVKVIECNLRASRSMPFISKTYNAAFMNLYATCSLYFFVTLNDCSQLPGKYADGPSRLHKAPKCPPAFTSQGELHWTGNAHHDWLSCPSSHHPTDGYRLCCVQMPYVLLWKAEEFGSSPRGGNVFNWWSGLLRRECPRGVLEGHLDHSWQHPWKLQSTSVDSVQLSKPAGNPMNDWASLTSSYFSFFKDPVFFWKGGLQVVCYMLNNWIFIFLALLKHVESEACSLQTSSFRRSLASDCCFALCIGLWIFSLECKCVRVPEQYWCRWVTPWLLRKNCWNR